MENQIITLLSASLEVLTSQNVRTDLVLIGHLIFQPRKCQMSDCTWVVHCQDRNEHAHLFLSTHGAQV